MSSWPESSEANNDIGFIDNVNAATPTECLDASIQVVVILHETGLTIRHHDVTIDRREIDFAVVDNAVMTAAMGFLIVFFSSNWNPAIGCR